MKRIPFLAALSLLGCSSVFGAEALQLDANENLFYVMAAANAAGYDEGINMPDAGDLRKQVREYLAQQDIQILPELKQYYRKHMAKPGVQAGVQDLAQYISYAFSVAGPPDFAWKGRDVEVPPDAMDLAGFTPLLIDFYRQAHLDDLWQKVRPAYETELQKYHSPLINMTTVINSYLRVAAGGYLGRRFSVFIELLGEPEQIQTRNYGDDAFVIATPSDKPRMYDIRHAYLLDVVQLSPLSEAYKKDFVLLANESLIKAVECRMDKDKTGVDRAMRQGYILTAYFYDQLPVFEKQDQSMRFYAQELANDIDLKKEIARIATVRFDAAPLQRLGKQVTVAGPELTPSAKTNEQAEDLYSNKKLEPARDLFLKSLEQRGSSEEHAQAWYGLARIALQQNQPDAAVKLFEKTLGASPDAFTKAWSLVYLARLSKAAGDPARAATLYREALAVPGASERAIEAARKESQNIPTNQETPK